MPNKQAGYALLIAMATCTLTAIIAMQLYQLYFFANRSTQNLYHYHDLMRFTDSVIEQAQGRINKIAIAELLAEPSVFCVTKPCILKPQQNNNLFLQADNWWESSHQAISKVFSTPGAEVGYFAIEKINKRCRDIAAITQCDNFFRVTVFVKNNTVHSRNKVQVILSRIISYTIINDEQVIVDAGSVKTESWAGG